MAKFEFAAQNANGVPEEGTIIADNRNAALQLLVKKYDMVTRLVEPRPKRSLMGSFKRGITHVDILTLFQQISVALGAGMTLKHCLDSLARDGSEHRTQTLVQDLGSALREGVPFSEALAQNPKIFPRYQCNLVRAGEMSGRLPETLGRLAEDMENSDNLTGEVKAAIAYPAFVLFIAFILSAALLAWGVPQVQKVYQGMGAQLPLPTRILILIGTALSTYWYICLALAALAFWGVQVVKRNKKLQGHLEHYLLRTYPVGDIFRNVSVAYYSRTLALLYRSGVPLTQAMEILQEAMRSQTMIRIAASLKESMVQGQSLSSAMRNIQFFPPLAVDMVVIGEESGCLEKMLSEVDRFYTRRSQTALKSLTSLLEPVLTVFVGILLGGIILGLGLPFLNLPSLML